MSKTATKEATPTAESLTIEELQARLAAAESEKAEYQAKLSAVSEEKDALASEKAEAQAKLSAVSAEKDAALTKVDQLAEEKAAISMERNNLASRVAAVDAEARAKAPVEFETEDGSKYEFTCPTFTWDDGIVYNVRKLEKEASKDAKAAEKYASICAQLIVRESGIIRKK